MGRGATCGGLACADGAWAGDAGHLQRLRSTGVDGGRHQVRGIAPSGPTGAPPSCQPAGAGPIARHPGHIVLTARLKATLACRLTISGDNFEGDSYMSSNQVTIGPYPCKVIDFYCNPQQIVCDTTPAQVPGNYPIAVVVNGDTQNAGESAQHVGSALCPQRMLTDSRLRTTFPCVHPHVCMHVRLSLQPSSSPSPTRPPAPPRSRRSSRPWHTRETPSLCAEAVPMAA